MAEDIRHRLVANNAELETFRGPVPRVGEQVTFRQGTALLGNTEIWCGMVEAVHWNLGLRGGQVFSAATVVLASVKKVSPG